MSRYYDPVTHRFVNSDGYFQSGGGLLDTNMNVYCRNNPVNCYDPTGTECKEHGSYYDVTCTYCNPYRREHLNTKRGIDYYNKIHGTNYIGVDDSGNMLERSFGQKVLDSAGAVIFSARADADVGVGFGGELAIYDGVVVSAVVEKQAYTIIADKDGFDYGWVKSSNIGLTIGPLDVFSTGYEDFESYSTGEHTISCADSHLIGFSVGAYVGVGASAEVGWDLDYIVAEFNEIWG